MRAVRLSILLIVALVGVSFAQLETVAREDTVIFDIDASTIATIDASLQTRRNAH